MSISDILRAVRNRWVGGVAVLLCCLLGAVAVWILRPAQYESKVTLYVSAQNAENITSANQGGQLAEQRTISYVELLRGFRLSAEVGRRLGLAEAPDAIARRLSVSSAADTVVITVAARDSDPQRARAIAAVVGEVFPAMVAELERPLNPRAGAQVAVRVAEEPVLPDRPAGPGLATYLAVGALLGLLAAVAYAVVRQTLDTSVRSSSSLQVATAAPHLGDIPYDDSAATGVLEANNLMQSRRSEGFRQLRTNLQFANVDSVVQVVLVTSSLANEGKSTTSANLGAALAAAGAKVVVVEADLRRPRASEYLGVERAVGLTSVLAGRASLGDVLQRWSRGGLDVVASGPTPPNPSELLGSQRMQTLLAELRSLYDYVLVDTPPVLAVADASTVAPFVDGVLLVCRYGKTTYPQVAEASDAVRAVSGRLIGTVLTMVPSNRRARGYDYTAYHQPGEELDPETDVTARPLGSVSLANGRPRSAHRAPEPVSRPRPGPRI